MHTLQKEGVSTRGGRGVRGDHRSRPILILQQEATGTAGGRAAPPAPQRAVHSEVGGGCGATAQAPPPRSSTKLRVTVPGLKPRLGSACTTYPCELPLSLSRPRCRHRENGNDRRLSYLTGL